MDRLHIVGSPRTPDFDAVLALALELTGCRAGLIGLMEGNRLWFKSEIGMGQTDMPRAVSLGNHTLLQSGPLVVEDLSEDDRFRDNDLVKERGIHFYAGIALAAITGENVGTLCLTDRSPRAAEPELHDILRELGRIVEGMIEAYAHTSEAMATAKMAEVRGQELWRKTRLIEQSERLAKVGAWEMDVETRMFSMSEEAARIHGLAKGDIMTIGDVRSRMDPALVSHANAWLNRCIEKGEGYEYTGRIFSVEGESRWTQVIAEAEQREGKVVRIFGTVRDRTADHLAEQNLRRAAEHDVLTDAPYRHCWGLRLDEAVARATADHTALTILMFDLDGFKEINDTRGHAAGDQVLREISRRLTEILPADAFYARLGGDEFAILFEGAMSPSELDGSMSRLFDAIRPPIMIDGTAVRISGTFGCAAFPDDASTAPDLMRNADIALYQAKRINRSSFVVYTSDIGDLFEQKRGAIDMMTSAVDENRLVPFYQPKIDLRTGAVIGFEALCRIETEAGAILTPSEFEPGLDSAASVRIGTAMLDLVTDDIAYWSAVGLAPGRIALSLTGTDFADGTLTGRIMGRLAALGIAPSTLEIQLTEKIILGRDAAFVDAALRELQREGIVISLDDFGIGYGSLSRLRDAPIKYIKLDRSFVACLQAGDNSIIVKSIVDLAHSLSMRVVAEGIETMAQAEFVRALGCDEAQGSFFAPPLSRARTQATLTRMWQIADQTSECRCA